MTLPEPYGKEMKNRRNNEKFCHSEDGYAVRGNLLVGCCRYIGAYVAVGSYREIATGAKHPRNDKPFGALPL